LGEFGGTVFQLRMLGIQKSRATLQEHQEEFQNELASKMTLVMFELRALVDKFKLFLVIFDVHSSFESSNVTA
jgi:hypothetical protein